MQETRSIREIFSPIFTRGDKTLSEAENAESCRRRRRRRCRRRRRRPRRRCFTADEKNSSDTHRFRNKLMPSPAKRDSIDRLLDSLLQLRFSTGFKI